MSYSVSVSVSSSILSITVLTAPTGIEIAVLLISTTSSTTALAIFLPASIVDSIVEQPVNIRPNRDIEN